MLVGSLIRSRILPECSSDCLPNLALCMVCFGLVVGRLAGYGFVRAVGFASRGSRQTRGEARGFGWGRRFPLKGLWTAAGLVGIGVHLRESTSDASCACFAGAGAGLTAFGLSRVGVEVATGWMRFTTGAAEGCDRSRPARWCMMAGMSKALGHLRAVGCGGAAGVGGPGMRSVVDACFSHRLWYISHMGSVKVLEGLGPVFSTREFERAAGVRPSSASRALGELAAGGRVEKIRRGTWRNFCVEWPSAADQLVGAGPVSHHWTAEWEAELEAAYGSASCAESRV